MNYLKAMTMRLKRNIFFITVLFAYIANISYAQIPTSALSKEVIKRLKPTLEKKLADKSLKFGSPVFIRIFKKTNELELWVKKSEKYKLYETYKICYYSGDLGSKLKQGDCQSPEGFYYVTPGRLNPFSTFHLSMNIGYPNSYDRYHKRTGSAIMIHGDCVSIGCYAMTDPKIEEIYTLADAAFRNGQPFFRVHIFPFRLNDEELARHERSKWFEFWDNLSEGYRA